MRHLKNNGKNEEKMSKKFVCESCGEECIMELQAIAKNGDRICYGCEEEYYAPCHWCEELFPKKELETDCNNNWVCDECVHSDEYFICEYCEEITPINEQSEHDSICNYCLDRYVECTECKDIVPKEDMTYTNGKYYCDECINHYKQASDRGNN